MRIIVYGFMGMVGIIIAISSVAVLVYTGQPFVIISIAMEIIMVHFARNAIRAEMGKKINFDIIQVCCIVFLLSGIPFLFLGAEKLNETVKVRTTGESTTAQITDVFQNTTYVRVTYMVDGVVYEEIPLDGRSSDMTKGDLVTVYYYPEEPKVLYDGSIVGAVILLVLGLFFAGGGLFGICRKYIKLKKESLYGEMKKNYAIIEKNARCYK